MNSDEPRMAGTGHPSIMKNDREEARNQPGPFP